MKLHKATAMFGISTLILVGWATLPAGKKAPTQTNVHVWSRVDSLAYARKQIDVWAEKQYACLANLWGKESAWNSTSYNKVKSRGMNAGGIPQLLGLSTRTPPKQQIDKGLAYIYNRYGIPCTAWTHWKRKGWS